MISIFWDISKPLAYNAFLNFITGNRGGGKTYGAKKWAIQHFIKTGQKFVWVRRYKTEFADNDVFFGKVSAEFPDKNFSVKGKSYFMDKKEIGRSVVLSTSRMKKGAEYPDFDTIIFDEFLIDKGVYHYLPGEVEVFLDLIDTVFRGRNDVRVFCLANTITVANPYFNYFHIMPPECAGIICKNDVLIEIVADEDYMKMKSESRFGQLISGTAYGAYNIQAGFRQDTQDFIAKREGKCVYLYTLVYKDMEIGVWANYSNGRIYCSQTVDKHCNLRFVLTLEDMRPNTLLLSTMQRGYLKNFMVNFRNGNVFAENQNVKKLMFEIANLLKSA